LSGSRSGSVAKRKTPPGDTRRRKLQRAVGASGLRLIPNIGTGFDGRLHFHGSSSLRLRLIADIGTGFDGRLHFHGFSLGYGWF
jgi:hypothetical protein